MPPVLLMVTLYCETVNRTKGLSALCIVSAAEIRNTTHTGSGNLLYAEFEVCPPGARAPGAEVYNFYIDIRTAYKDYDEFYQRVLDEGTNFIRGRVAEVTDAARMPGEDGKLIVQVEDTLAAEQRRIPVDMIILSAALEPRHDSDEVAQLFRYFLASTNGWFTEKHPKLDPVATMTEGIFIAGAATGPKDIPQSVSQGSAAAARVISYIQSGELALEPVRASVIEENALAAASATTCVHSMPSSPRRQNGY